MSRKSLAFVIALSGIAVLLFQNCGQGFQKTNSSSGLSFCKLDPQEPSSFVSSKIAIRNSFFSSQHKLQVDGNEKKYSLVVNSLCLNDLEEPLLFLKQDIHVPNKFKDFEKVSTSISLPVSVTVEELEEELEKSECLIAIAENQEVKASALRAQPVNDPEARRQAHLTYLGHSTARGVMVDITEPVIVAFVDSGVDIDHPEISSRLWSDGSGNHGTNIVGNNSDVDDVDSHGTHVAGIVAAVENNGQGGSGLTDSFVEVMAIKVLERGAGNSQNVANGIRWATRNGADIINLSIEARGQNIQIEDAIREAVAAGVFVTAAAGNQAEQITTTNLFAPAYLGPQLNGVMSVGSIDLTDNLLSLFSNYSSTFIEIAAPGAETSSNTTNSGGILSLNVDGGLARIQGTSQSTPMVSAAAAMIIGFLKTNDIPYSPAGVESFIKSDGSMLYGGLAPHVAKGRILQLGFLAENLNEYINSTEKPNFNEEVTTGNLCRLN